MMFTVLNLITISKEKTGLEALLEKYVKEGFIESFAPGEPVFILKNKQKTNQAKKMDIDWEAMDNEALKRARKEAESWGKSEDEEFIDIRLKVQKRPVVFIGRDGIWHDEEEGGIETVAQGIADYDEIWTKSFAEAGDEDVLTHWDFR